jgi:hypothetical protein
MDILTFNNLNVLSCGIFTLSCTAQPLQGFSPKSSFAARQLNQAAEAARMPRGATLLRGGTPDDAVRNPRPRETRPVGASPGRGASDNGRPRRYDPHHNDATLATPDGMFVASLRRYGA